MRTWRFFLSLAAKDKDTPRTYNEERFCNPRCHWVDSKMDRWSESDGVGKQSAAPTPAALSTHSFIRLDWFGLPFALLLTIGAY
jgi:hypothetical protein